MSRAYALTVVGLLLLMASCKPSTPSQYIQPDDMEDILVDYYLARALAQHNDGASIDEHEFNYALYVASVLEKHGVTQADFDSSLVYYFTRADRFDDILQRVSERLDEQALALGASEGEIGKYVTYNATGDTANIWADRPSALLMPVPPYNRWEFAIPADSTYRKGDALMMLFMSDYMYQTGSKNGVLYMAVEYDDTTVTRNLHFSVSGISQLRVSEDTTRVIKGIKGFFYLDGGFEPSTSIRLLFLNNVQLIRFHTKDEERVETDSITRDSIGGQLPADSIRSRDSIRSGAEVLPLDSGAALHGVAGGADSAATRREEPLTRVP